jgi:hypothetical protein
LFQVRRSYQSSITTKGGRMKVIVSKYLGPTNTKGARVKVTVPYGKSITVPWDYSLDAFFNHDKACLALLEKINMKGKVLTAWFKDGQYIHIID